MWKVIVQTDKGSMTIDLHGDNTFTQKHGMRKPTVDELKYLRDLVLEISRHGYIKMECEKEL